MPDTSRLKTAIQRPDSAWQRSGNGKHGRLSRTLEHKRLRDRKPRPFSSPNVLICHVHAAMFAGAEGSLDRDDLLSFLCKYIHVQGQNIYISLLNTGTPDRYSLTILCTNLYLTERARKATRSWWCAAESQFRATPRVSPSSEEHCATWFVARCAPEAKSEAPSRFPYWSEAPEVQNLLKEMFLELLRCKLKHLHHFPRDRKIHILLLNLSRMGFWGKSWSTSAMSSLFSGTGASTRCFAIRSGTCFWDEGWSTSAIASLFGSTGGIHPLLPDSFLDVLLRRRLTPPRCPSLSRSAVGGTTTVTSCSKISSWTRSYEMNYKTVTSSVTGSTTMSTGCATVCYWMRSGPVPFLLL